MGILGGGLAFPEFRTRAPIADAPEVDGASVMRFGVVWRYARTQCTIWLAMPPLLSEMRGAGEPVVLVHAGIFADWFAPLLEEPALTSRYRVVSYHRVGYAGSSHPAGPISIAQQATHLRSLMRHLGIERAHLVGHSSGGNIALQLALDAPNTVRSLAILEPALPVAPSAAPGFLSATPRGADAAERYRADTADGRVGVAPYDTAGCGVVLCAIEPRPSFTGIGLRT